MGHYGICDEYVYSYRHELSLGRKSAANAAVLLLIVGMELAVPAPPIRA
jgi:hypothetical protein